MDPDTLRAMERILAVLMGGLLIYLGYRLFLQLPDRTDSAGKIILPGNISIYLSRVGPGIFMALFGAAVVAFSLHNTVTYRETLSSTEACDGNAPHAGSTSDETQLSPGVREYSGIGERGTVGTLQSLEVSRAMVKRDIFILNSLSNALRTDLNTEDQVDIELAVPRIKVALLKTVWAEDWGDPEAFEDWVFRSAAEDPPQELEAAAAFYDPGLQEGRR